MSQQTAAEWTVENEIDALSSHWRAANYLACAQIYLRDNVLLEQPLAPQHIKPRLLGHWGTAPGINFVYTHLNRLIRHRKRKMLLVTGPGHGAAANLANLFLEGTLGEYYPELQRNRDGLTRLIKSFSWPSGFASHLTPRIPGTIHEGGELGYALATAFGAAFDNPELIVPCIVGDGEAETGPTATAWHGTKYLNPARDGAVLPILHLNEYKIASRTLFGSMDRGELETLFRGYGYEVLYLETGNDPRADHQRMCEIMDRAADRIDAIQASARHDAFPSKPKWPVVLLRSPKGWTGIKSLDGDRIEGSYRAHQVPVSDPQESSADRDALQRWLRSYRPEELFDPDGCPRQSIVAACPKGDLRMGMNHAANGGSLRTPLDRPDWREYAVKIENRGQSKAADTRTAGGYLRDLIDQNRDRFRIVCPDEMDSNRLSAVFESTQRQYLWPTAADDESIGVSGNVLEVLSEHTCQAWLQGYLLTGRHGLFPCYEAFVSIVDSMMGQYAKFLKQAEEVAWRKPISSFNYLLSSEGWRQDHNGYSHQMPGFLNMLLNKKAANVRIYLPPDANCLLSTLDHCMTSTNKINLIIASKQPMPQWLDAREAAEHCRRGASVWRWASTYDGEDPDVVLASSGSYPTTELLAAASLLRKNVPDLRVRVVNVTDLLILELDSHHPHGLSDGDFHSLFTADRPVIYNFHGYPSAVKQLLWDRKDHGRFDISGYCEEGTTTTPFTLLAENGVDRYRVAIRALRAAHCKHPTPAERDSLVKSLEDERSGLLEYAAENGDDAAELTQWRWENDE